MNTRLLIGVGLMALVISYVAARLVVGVPDNRAWLVGWGGTMTIMTATEMFRRVLRPFMTGQVAWVLALSVFRLLILLIFIGVVLVGSFLQVGSFLTGVLVTYFATSWTEIALLLQDRR